MEVTAAGTAPVFHRIPLHRQTDLSVRLLIPWGKITIYFIIVKFMGLNSTSGAYKRNPFYGKWLLLPYSLCNFKPIIPFFCRLKSSLTQREILPCVFYVSRTGDIRFPKQKRTSPTRETYGSKWRNIKNTLTEYTIRPSVFLIHKQACLSLANIREVCRISLPARSSSWNGNGR